MANRVFSVTIRATDELAPALLKSERAASSLQRSMSGVQKTATTSLKGAASSAGGLGSMLGQLNAGALTAGAGLAYMVKTSAEFEKSMSAVAANTGATGKSLADLREAAITMGGATAFSSKEAADGINELGKAGLSTASILGGGLKGALDLAASGQMGVADAAEAMASSLNQFSLDGSQASHVADVLSITANKASGNVADFAVGMKQVGGVAHMTGLSLEETSGWMGLLAEKGMTGSDAATSIKTAIMRLNPTTKEASKEMEALGIHAYDANGQFIGLQGVAGQLSNAYSRLTPEARAASMQVIFGSDAVRAANVLFEGGAEGIKRWTDSYANGAGFAAQNAKMLQDNLSGDWEKLTGSIESATVRSSSSVNSLLRDVTQAATGTVDALSGMGGALSGAVEVGAAIGGLVLLRKAGESLGTTAASTGAKLRVLAQDAAAVSRGMNPAQINATAASLERLGYSASAARTQAASMQVPLQGGARAMGGLKAAGGAVMGLLGGPWGLAIAGAGLGLGLLAQRSQEAAEKQQQLAGVVDSVASAINAQNGAFGSQAAQTLVSQAAADGYLDAMQKIGYSTAQATQALVSDGAARQAVIGQMDAHIAKLQETGMVVDATSGITTNAYQAEIDQTQAAKDKLLQYAGAGSEAVAKAQQNAEAQKAAAAATGQAGAAAGQAGVSMEQYKDATASVEERAATLAQTARQLSAELGFNQVNAMAAGGGLAEYIDKTTGAVDATKLFSDALKLLNGGFSAEEAVDNWNSAVLALSGSLDKGTRSLTGNTAGAIKNREAMRGMVEKAGTAAEAMLRNGDSATVAGRKLDAMKAQLQRAAAQAGLSRAETARYTGALDKIKSNYRSTIVLSGAETAQEKADRFYNSLQKLAGKVFTNRVRTVFETVGQVQQNLGLRYENGGIVTPRANGGIDQHGRYVPRVSQIANGRNILWGEPEIGGPEAYISSKRGQEKRNVAILQEAASWFGLSVSKQFENGGIVGTRALANGGLLSGTATSLGTALLNSPTGQLVIDATANITKLTTSAGANVLKLAFAFDDGAMKTLTSDLKSLLTGKDAVRTPLDDYRDGWTKVRDALSSSVKDSKELSDKLTSSTQKVADARKKLAELNEKRAWDARIQAEDKRLGLDKDSKTAAKAAKDYATLVKRQAAELVAVKKAKASYDAALSNLAKVEKGHPHTKNGKTTYTPSSPEELKAARSRVDAAKAAWTNKNSILNSTARQVAALKPAATARSAGTLKGALGSAKAKPYLSTIFAMSQKYGVPAELIAAQIQQESGFKANAKSGAGARGLMQLMPGTFRGLGVKGSITDPTANIEAGAKYMAQMLKQQGGNVQRALAAYNAGPGNVKRWQSIRETRGYVANITRDAGVKAVTSAGGTIVRSGATTATKSSAAAVNKAAATVANSRVLSMIENSEHLVGRYYKWGGGHSSTSHKANLDKALVDCSGLINVALGHTLKKNVNRVAKDWTRGKGIKAMSVKDALQTAGAFIGSSHHVMLSLGNGMVREAPQTGKKVRDRKLSAKEIKNLRAGWYEALGAPQKATAAQLKTGAASSSTTPVNKVKAQYDAMMDARQKAEEAKNAQDALVEAIKEMNADKLAIQVNNFRKEQREALLKMLDKAQPQMEKLFTAREEVTKQLSDEQEALDKLQGSYDSLSASVAAAAADMSSLSTLWKEKQDDWGDTVMPSISDVIRSRKENLAATSAFRQDIEDLKTLGLNDTDLEDLIKLGSEKGSSLAKAIKQQGESAVALLNDTAAQMAKESQALGKTAGSSLYQAGIDAKTKLIDGLKAKEAEFDKTLSDLASKIAAVITQTYALQTAQTALTQTQAQAQASTAKSNTAAISTAKVTVSAPSSVTVVDANGALIGTMKTVASSTTKAVLAKETTAAKWSK